MADNNSKTDNEDFYEIDPEGPDALDLLNAAEADAAEAAEEAAAVDGAADSAGAAGTLEQVTAERDALQAQLLRVSADYQNFARRSQQNIASAAEQTQMSMARALVPVLDHFDRALESAAQQEHDAESGATPSGDLLRGVTMVKEELLNTLGRFGIERLEVTIGDEFDPVRHEALMRQPAEGVASNHITMLMLPGYVLGEKVVRPAQVGVAE